ncbi:S41 family peptidase [Streptomyces sp. NPDC101219]|uniref:S41 family peptidase n=1 Tax=Streptomyces sp. NPDC101219 TaxID=3366131 RepID=UPI0037F96357
MSGRDLFCQPRRLRRGAALTLVFASVLVAGAATGSLPGAGPVATADGARSALPAGHHTEVSEAAREAMADGTSPVEAAQRAVSRSGDRWAAVYSQSEYEEFEEALDGQYTGVGLWACARDGRIEVTRVGDGSPADRAGIRVGDRLRSVDGAGVDGRPVTEVVALLRGDNTDAPAGTRVRLGLERDSRTWTETVRRARLSRESVAVRELAGQVTVVTVGAFTKGSGEQVRKAVRRAPAGAGIVLDLRGNSGGLVTEAVTAASAFLDGGLVATYDVDGEQRALHADPGGDTARPLVALVDGGTMSAAELLTGALQDRGRAVVVGSRTFGKGSVQMPSRLPGGSVAELTVGHYRTPSGRGVDGRGITPDAETDDDALERATTVLRGLGRQDAPRP